MIVDFHLHTTESDGRLSPSELFDAVSAAGLDYFSVTDHDTTAAYLRYPDALAPLRRRLVIGMEVSTHVAGRDIHVLAYNVPLGDSPLRSLLGDRSSARRMRAAAILQRLHDQRIQLDPADVANEARGQSVGRAHIARALVARGFARDVDDAFERYLAAGASAYVPLTKLTPAAAVEAIRESGGVAAIAHPSRARADDLIEDLARCGMQAIEVFYPSHLPHDVARYRALASSLGLAMTAGSDFHEPTEGRPRPGCIVDDADIEPFLKLVL